MEMKIQKPHLKKTINRWSYERGEWGDCIICFKTVKT